MKRKYVVYYGALVAVALMSGIAQAAVVTFSTTTPTPGALYISSFVGAAQDLDNVGTATADGGANDGTTYVAFDRGAQGQTFLTGSKAGGYQITGVWVRHAGYTANTDATWYMMPVGSQLGIRVTNPSASGTAGFVLASETYTVTGSEPGVLPPTITNTPNGTGTWIHVVLGAPVALAVNKTYGFDLTGIRTTGFGADLFIETLGIKDTAIGGNPYAAGSAYVSGSNGLADNVLTTAPGDRVFVVELVPEPATIALLGLGGLALLRRKS
jgi:hypothetical protein